METIVGCKVCGSLVLQRYQAQHDGFHQRHGHVQAIDFTGPLPLLTEEDVRRLAPKPAKK
ncbi:MAG: hypothetical protein HYT80_02480 [Euryarchaeota archaeon]|nr:hypothetical protein [Euryarchaeota archaeon]